MQSNQSNVIEEIVQQLLINYKDLYNATQPIIVSAFP